MKLFDQVGDICIGIWHIARLQWQQFHLGLLAERVLQRGDVVHKFDRAVVADVEDAPRGQAAARVRLDTAPVGIGRCRSVDDADHGFDNVVDVGEIPSVLAIVEHRNFLAGENSSGEFEQRHVRTSPWTIDGKEPQTRSRQAVKMAVGVGHQFVGLFAGGVQALGMIDVLMNRERHGGVGAIDARTAGIDEVVDTVATATFEDVGETDDVAIDVGERVLDGVAHASLGGEVDDTLRLMSGEGCFHCLTVDEVDPQVGVVRMISMPRETGFLDGRVVVVVVVVDADDNVTSLEQTQGQVRANKTGRTGDEHLHESLLKRSRV